MAQVYASIELVNATDIEFAKRGFIAVYEIRRTNVKMLVDSGSYLLAINENIQAFLELPLQESRRFVLADHTIVEYPIVGPVQVRFENRQVLCSAMVLPGDAEPLLGSIPMEEMDVLIHPLRQELIINPEHPDMAYSRL